MSLKHYLSHSNSSLKPFIISTKDFPSPRSISALRADLSMMRTALTKKLNDYVGEQVITDIKFD